MRARWPSLNPSWRRLYLFFGTLSLWTVAGPGLAVFSLNRGYNDRWPPENAWEWAGLGLAVGGFAILMLATLLGAWQQLRTAPKYVRRQSGPNLGGIESTQG